MAKTADWLSYEHPEFSALKGPRALVRAMYTGDGAAGFLKRFTQGESPAQFEARKALATHLPHTADVLDTLAGMLFAAPVERSFGALGDPEARGTAAYRLLRDADGSGTPYEGWLRECAVELLTMQECFVLVDPMEDGQPRLRLIPTLSVPNWVESNGAVTEAVVAERADTRASVTEDPAPEERFVVYSPTGWARYRRVEGKAPVLLDSGTYAESGRAYVTRAGEPTAPVTRVRLPFRRHVAHQLAQAHLGLYSRRSDRDALARAAAYPKLVLSATVGEYDEAIAKLKRGTNVLRLDPENTRGHEYIGAPTDSLAHATEALGQDTQALYDTFWRLLQAEGQMAKTATGAALERAAGAAAALALVASAMEELEGSALHLAEQAVTDDAARWTSSVEWDKDYAPVEVEAPTLREGPVTG